MNTRQEFDKIKEFLDSYELESNDKGVYIYKSVYGSGQDEVNLLYLLEDFKKFITNEKPLQ